MNTTFALCMTVLTTFVLWWLFFMWSEDTKTNGLFKILLMFLGTWQLIVAFSLVRMVMHP